MQSTGYYHPMIQRWEVTCERSSRRYPAAIFDKHNMETGILSSGIDYNNMPIRECFRLISFLSPITDALCIVLPSHKFTVIIFNILLEQESQLQANPATWQ
jgi:hypothetical protein